MLLFTCHPLLCFRHSWQPSSNHSQSRRRYCHAHYFVQLEHIWGVYIGIGQWCYEYKLQPISRRGEEFSKSRRILGSFSLSCELLKRHSHAVSDCVIKNQFISGETFSTFVCLLANCLSVLLVIHLLRIELIGWLFRHGYALNAHWLVYFFFVLHNIYLFL